MLQLLNRTFTGKLPWQISVDAADSQYFWSPLYLNTSAMLPLGFGNFIGIVSLSLSFALLSAWS